ncbi:flavin-containing amine oxidase, putative [Talaromyces stipitatus ATCC 10500]|uniref:Amine oxidase n=1 Tax=Talaromyces stipitatus (strain ATCC 10500 / CBS 375.48 / QM 6759 / NRRL 1006) TaxID=441959 RepID=B8MDX4_TALSN|nr:flavin-containing amine oxidase, putative [Talaromyces stipitatus ATCC 10500]EED16051.1 flavin-containing amine oxidase, putative [Talaromyces stipitatus ATCC 10500]
MSMSELIATLRENDQIVDCIVVGAGLSGLAAAEELVAARKSVLVLEARDRVGGKVYDVHFSTPSVSGYVEAGASFVGAGQTEIVALAERLSLRLFDTHEKGKKIVFPTSGERKLFDPEDPAYAEPPMPMEAIAQAMAAVAELDELAAELDRTTPWTHPKAQEWDSQTLHSWMESRLTHPDARAFILAQWRALLSAEPADVSFLQALSYIVRATDDNLTPPAKGNWARLTDVKGGGQEARIEGGTQLLPIGLAKRLGSQVVKTNAPVTGISKQGAEYRVYVERGLEAPKVIYKARSVVLALSPPLVSRLSFEPPLPARNNLVGQRMNMGALGKAIAVYEKPFWRDEGLSGQVFCLSDSHVQVVFDDSPANLSCGVVMGFLVGNTARELDALSDEQVQQLILRDYIRFFGPKAADVKHWIIQRWDREEYSRGGHFALCPPNVMTVYGRDCAEPVGNIFFAGTELSDQWAGFMEGAVRAGRAAAGGVIKRLGETSLPDQVSAEARL